MSTTIPIQDLDPSSSPPSDRTIRAVVTLSWPYSSSTRQCALLLSERDFRLRTRGGQIRVKFSGPAARAVAGSKLGIGDEVLLELGAGEWAAGAPVHVPGKSVGELHFGRGVQLRVQKEGRDDVEVSIADDAVDEAEEEETSQLEVAPAKVTSPATTFRSSIGAPGSAAIYSSPAYMRKAAKFSYLDGISRLFEDEWDNQDLPRKKARTSMGDVKSWKVVDRTPSPEPPSSAGTVSVDEEMADASQVEQTNAEDTVVEALPPVASVSGQELVAEMRSARSSPTPAPRQQGIRPSSPTSVINPLSSPPQLLAARALEEQRPLETEAAIDDSALPKLRLPSNSPTPQPSEPEDFKKQAVDPITPRLVPLSSAVLPSTTPQISPLATKDAFAAEKDDDRANDVETISDEALPSEDTAKDGPIPSTSPSKATESLLDQLKSTAGESEPATEPVLPEHDVFVQRETWDLAEEDAFSDDEANEALSAHENDDDLMLEEDAEDVFDADELEGEEPSDDDTDEDLEMRQLPSQQWLEESTTEKDSDIEEQASVEDQMDGKMSTQPHVSVERQAVSQPPGFAPASSLLHATETPAKAIQPSAAVEDNAAATPPKQPFFGLDGAVPTTEAAEVTTPAPKPTDTPKRTPQSARDKVMKRTFSSLFGIKATPSPEKEDMSKDGHAAGAEQVVLNQTVQSGTILDSTQAGQPLDNGVNESHSLKYMALDGSNEAAVELTGIETPIFQDENESQNDAGPQVLRATSPSIGESPDQVSHGVQKEAEQPEEAASAPAQSPELVKLDSSSDAEENDDSLNEAEDNRTDVESSTLASTPQKRSATRTSGVDSPAVANINLAEKAATATHDDVVESTMLETAHPNAEDPSNQAEHPNVEQILPVEDHREPDLHTPDDAGMRVLVQEDGPASPDLVMQSDQFVSDSNEKPSALSPAHMFPTAQLEEPTAVDAEVQEQVDPEPSHAPIDQAPADVEEVSPELPEALQSSDSHQEQAGDAAPAIAEEPMVISDEVEIVEPSQGDDVEMLDDERRESETSQASFQSQVLHDSIDAHKSSLHEHSSRPTSRDTVEDFSPMVLGSMAQRITDLVNEESSLMRMQELQAQDEMEVEQPFGDAMEMPSMSNFVEDDLLEQTPTRSTTLPVVEVGSSPSESHTISPVKFTRGTQEQEPTPQATFDKDTPGATATDKEVDIMQEIPENRDYLATSDAQAVESQLQAEVLDEQISNSAIPLTPELVEQQEITITADEKDEQAHLTLLMSRPSATQAARPEAQLSHAIINDAAMQPTPATSRLQSSVQLLADLNHIEALGTPTNMSQAQSRDQELAEVSESIANMPRPQSREKEQTTMPPPEQSLPTKTPARKSLRSRLSNVPDVISAWFSPKRSSIAAQETEERPEVDKLPAASVEVTENVHKSKRRASGLSTAHAYFTSLASLSQHVNPSSQQVGTVDILAVVTDFAKEPERAKGGPRDYYTIFRVTDPSMSGSTNVRVEVFRPWKAVLPAADVGDVVLLRAFVVKSKKRQPYLLSTDTSAWCVWRFAEHSKATARGGAADKDGEKPTWARRMSHSEVREEVKGPPVEYGMAEKEQARKLREWWIETHGETEGGASEELVNTDTEEEVEIVEL